MRLLGLLKQRGFLPWAEVIATRSIDALVTAYPPLGGTLAALVTDAPDEAARPWTWRSEQEGDGAGRTDLQGNRGASADAGPVALIIEAKLTAPLGVGQLLDYVGWFPTGHLASTDHQLLAVLVPMTRQHAAARVLATAMDALDRPPATRVVTWESVISTLRARAATLPFDSEGVLSDLAQIEALVEAAQGVAVEPFEPIPAPELIRTRRWDLGVVLDQVGYRLNADASYPSPRLMPLRTDVAGLVGHRYFQDGPGQPNLFVGISEPDSEYAREGAVMVVRWHPKTPGYRAAMDALRAAEVEVRGGADDPWVALDVPRGEPGRVVTERLTHAIQELDQIARQGFAQQGG